MRTVLVYPETPAETFWSYKYIIRKYLSQKSAFPPNGLLTVAAMLPEDWEKKLVDLNVRELTEEDLKWADIIFISAMLIQSESSSEVIKKCKEKGKIIVAGGPLFTSQYDKFPEIDHLLLGEAEEIMPEFLQDLKDGKARHIYKSDRKPDLSKTPIPMWELINFMDYVTLSIQFSRGCPFSCEFCDITNLFGHKIRTKSSANFLRELEKLYLLGYRKTIFIIDDNFIGNIKKTKELLRELILWQKQKNYPFKFLTQASINLADDDELLELMQEANFFKVFLGLETPSNESLKECGKNQNVGINIKEAVKKIHGYGIQVMAGFIVGFDGDTEEIFDLQEKFVQKIAVVTAMFGPLTVLPGTSLEKRLEKEGRLLGVSTGANNSFGINFVPKMGIEKLLKGYRRLVKKVYSRKKYYGRIYTFLEDYKPSVRGSGFSWDDFVIFLKSIVFIGVFSCDCFYYWIMLLRVLFSKKVKSLPVVLDMIIVKQHLARVANKM